MNLVELQPNICFNASIGETICFKLNKIMIKRISILLVLLLFLVSSNIFAQQKKKNLFSIEINGLCGYMNKVGKVVITPQFNTCWNFSEGVAGVIMNDKLGFIDETGKFKIHPQFNYDLVWFSEGFATIQYGSRSEGTHQRGFVDRNGIIKILPFVEYVSDFSEGLANFENGGLYGYIDRSMNVVIEPQYKYAGSFNDGLARVTDKNGNDYYIDKNGQKAVDRDASDFSEGLAFFEVENKYTGSKYGFIDTNGKTVIQPQFRYAGFFYEGLCAVQDSDTDKWGFIDKTGKFVIKPQFDSAERFSEGLADVEINNKWGYINKSGVMVIPPKFDAVDDFDNGIAKVELNDDWNYYIDKTGKFIWKPSN